MAKCPKCIGEMEIGYIPQKTGYPFSNRPAEAILWISGTPKYSTFGGLDTRGTQMMEITAYRCQKCRFLELFA